MFEETDRKAKVAALAISKRPSLHGGYVYKHAVTASVLSFVYFIAYGAALSSLGAALPFLESEVETSSQDDLAWVFTSRGVGFLLGTIFSAVLLEGVSFFGISYTPPFWFTEHKLLMFSISTVFLGGATSLVLLSTNYAAIITVFFVQGLGFGAADTIGNCLMPELWSEELNPWMQAFHCAFGVGGILGPALVGTVGFYWTYISLGVASTAPVLAYPYVSYLRKMAVEEMKEPYQKEDQLAGITPATEVVTAVAGGKEDGGKEKSCNNFDVTDPEKEKDLALLPLPRGVQGLVILFFLVYVGSEAGYGGWITSYVLDAGVATDKNEAAFMTAVYWGGLTVGRLVAIPCAIKVSTSSHLKFQLVLAAVAASLAVSVLDMNYTAACITSALYGYALSAMFPLALTLVNEYGFEVDPSATASFMCAACIGDAAIPVIVGLCMTAFGPEALPRTMAVFAALLVIVYVSIAHTSTEIRKLGQQQQQQPVESEESEKETQAHLEEIA